MQCIRRQTGRSGGSSRPHPAEWVFAYPWGLSDLCPTIWWTQLPHSLIEEGISGDFQNGVCYVLNLAEQWLLRVLFCHFEKIVSGQK